MKTFMKWTAAVALSVLVHAGAAAFFQPEQEEITEQVAGGEAMEVTLLGNAFEETLQAGEPDLAIDPLETQPEDVQPVEETQAAEIPPIETEVRAETPTDLQPVEADVVLPAEDIPPTVVAEAEVTATVAPVETVIPEEKPDIKPEPEKVEKPKEKPPEDKPKKVEPKPVKKQAGEKGQSVASNVKGQADGATNAASNMSSGKKGNVSQQAGNAAMSNYAGKVRSKVTRRFKKPRGADNGVGWIRFTILADGSVTGVGMSRSVGSAEVDSALVNAVHRAAPFPKLPDGRSRWEFTMQLVFK